MSEKISNGIKKSIESEMDLEKNERTLNRDSEKSKPVDGKNINNKKNANDEKENGFNYEKKYTIEDKIDLNNSIEESENSNKIQDDNQNTSGTKLNPRLEQITEPDPDDKKKVNYLTSMNKRNRNQPL